MLVWVKGSSLLPILIIFGSYFASYPLFMTEYFETEAVVCFFFAVLQTKMSCTIGTLQILYVSRLAKHNLAVHLSWLVPLYSTLFYCWVVVLLLGCGAGYMGRLILTVMRQFGTTNQTHSLHNTQYCSTRVYPSNAEVASRRVAGTGIFQISLSSFPTHFDFLDVNRESQASRATPKLTAKRNQRDESHAVL